MSDICNYTEYWKYLSARLTEEKKFRPHFSLQYIANQLGMSSKVQALRILKGERKRIPEEIIAGFDTLFKHTEKEKKYLRTMICFNEARDLKLKEKYLQELKVENKSSKALNLTTSQYAYYKHWFIPVIKELIEIEGYSGTEKELASLVTPKISLKDARFATSTLKQLEILVKDETERWIIKDSVIHAGHDLLDLASREFQKQHCDIAKNATDGAHGQLHQFTTATFGIDDEGLLFIKEKIRETQRDIVNYMTSREVKANQVYELNIQLYPLSKKKKN